MLFKRKEQEIQERHKAFANRYFKWIKTEEARYGFCQILCVSHRYLTIVVGCLLFGMYACGLLSLFSYLPELTFPYVVFLYSVTAIALTLCMFFPKIFTCVHGDAEKINLSFYCLIPGVLLAGWFVVSSIVMNGLIPDGFSGFSSRKFLIFYCITCVVLVLPTVIYSNNIKTFFARTKIIIAPLFAVLFSALGAVVSYNSFFDYSIPRVYETMIVKKPSLKELRDSSWEGFGFEVKPWRFEWWEPKGYHRIDLEVSQDLYGALNEGDRVCIYSYSGAAGIPWRKSDYCSESVE